MPAIQKISILTNQSNCAAMSMVWLSLVLNENKPIFQSTLFNRPADLRNAMDLLNLGGKSVPALERFGLKPYPISVYEAKNESWSKSFHYLLSLSKKFPNYGFYLTVRWPPSGAHAMAFWGGPNNGYFFEPDSGVYKVSKSYSGAEAMAAVMERTGHRVSSVFKIYGVELKGRK